MRMQFFNIFVAISFIFIGQLQEILGSPTNNGQDCQGIFFPECRKRIHGESKEVGLIECWGKPLYAYCKAMDGTVFHIPGFYCEHSTCPTDAKAQNTIHNNDDYLEDCSDNQKCTNGEETCVAELYKGQFTACDGFKNSKKECFCIDAQPKGCPEDQEICAEAYVHGGDDPKHKTSTGRLGTTPTRRKYRGRCCKRRNKWGRFICQRNKFWPNC